MASLAEQLAERVLIRGGVVVLRAAKRHDAGERAALILDRGLELALGARELGHRRLGRRKGRDLSVPSRLVATVLSRLTSPASAASVWSRLGSPGAAASVWSRLGPPRAATSV
jgi:hypothetical protein